MLFLNMLPCLVMRLVMLSLPEYDRTYGWGPRGEPVVMTQQLSDDVQYSWMAAADKDGLCHEMCELLDTSQAGGNVDGERFLGWARSRLFPGLGNYSRREARSIVVMDNCRLVRGVVPPSMTAILPTNPSSRL